MSSNTQLEPSRMLNGYRLLEWVPETAPELVHIAVAFAGRLLTDLGAEIVRVPPTADPLIGIRSFVAEEVGSSSILATFLNHGKRKIVEADVSGELAVLDLAMLGASALEARVERDGEALPTVQTAGVRPGVGLDDLELSELGIQGLVGLTDLFGEPDAQPLMLGGHQTAYATGYATFCAVMAALAKLKWQGASDRVEVNAVDALAWVNWKGVAAGALGFPVGRGGRGAQAPVLKCADGYFAFLHLPNNWSDICDEIGDPRLLEDRFSSGGRRAQHAFELNEILADWARQRTRTTLYEFCQRCAIPGGPVLDGVDLLKDPLYVHRQYLQAVDHGGDERAGQIIVPGLPLTVEDTASGEPAVENRGSKRAWMPSASADLPLTGMLVLDLGIFTAGSVTSTLLADLGARVIKVESESYSDPFRVWPGIKGDSPLFTFNNRNKLGANLDLKTDSGRAAFLELVAQADVVVENFRRGVLGRLGIDYPALKAANPRIVLASVSGQGASGPGSGHVSFGSTLEAIGGVAALTGYARGPCYISGRNLNYPDQIVCLYGAGAVIAAVLKAKELGYGMHIDVSQREVTTLAVGEQVAAASLNVACSKTPQGREFPGNGNLNAVLQDIYKVQDGWLCITVANEQQHARLAELLGCTAENVGRTLPQWLAGSAAKDAGVQVQALGIAAFKANTGAEAAAEPAVQRGTAFSKTASGVMVKGFPFQFAKTPLTIYAESPRMGEHTDLIVAGL